MALLVYDAFDGTSGADLSAHAPDTDVVGGGWLDSGANEVELDGSGAIKFSSSGKNCAIDSGQLDQIVTTNFNAGGADNRITIGLRSAGLLATGTENYYNLNFRTGDTTNSLQIYKIIGGVGTLLASSGNLGISNTTTYELKGKITGSSIEFYVDGVLELSTTNSDITTGTHVGIRHQKWTDGNARFYDFQVDDAVSPAIIAPDNQTQTQTLTSPALTQSSVLSVDSISQAQTVGEPILLQAHILTVDNITQTQSIENVSMTVAGALSVQGLSQSQVLQNAEVVQQSILSVQSIYQSHSLQNAELAQESGLTIQPISQAQGVESADLVSGGTIPVNNITQLQLLDESGISQNYLLFTDDLTQPQSLTVVNFGSEQDISGVTVSFKDNGINVEYKADAITVSFR